MSISFMSISNIFNHEQLLAVSSFYNERHRHYHTLEHIHHCLSEYRSFVKDDKQSWSCAIELAIWFHDIIYDPRAEPGQNEADSVAMFKSIRYREKSSELGSKVIEMIMATATHKSDDFQIQIMLDVDMAILGSSPIEYSRYMQNVRKEYGFLSDEEWKVGRKTFLISLLQRPTIFLTPYFQAKYQTKARQNIGEELLSL